MANTIPKEELEKLVKTFKNNGSLLFKSIGIPTDFTIESLITMEKVINELYPFGHQPMITTYIPFGIHLGEVLIHLIPEAKWEFDDVDHIFNLTISCPGKDGATARVKPIQRIRNFWHDRTDTIFGFAEMVRDLSLGTLQPPEKEGEWIDRSNGTKIRSFSVPKDATEEQLAVIREKMRMP